MASAVSTERCKSRAKRTMYITTSASSATDVAWVDMRDYDTFLVGVCAASLAGNGITAFKILANANSDGSGTDVEIKAHAVGSAPDAVGDYLWLECTAAEIAHLAEENNLALRYVSANIDCDNASDVICSVYELGGPRFAYSGLTADHVS